MGKHLRGCPMAAFYKCVCAVGNSCHPACECRERKVEELVKKWRARAEKCRSKQHRPRKYHMEHAVQLGKEGMLRTCADELQSAIEGVKS